MELNLNLDNRTELNKIFLLYSHLDMSEKAQEVYLDFMVKNKISDIAGGKRPVVLEEKDLIELMMFFKKEFLPAAKQLLTEEVRIGVPQGRIMEVMGSDLRFSTSEKLIRKFVNEYYGTMVKKMLNREVFKKIPNGDALLLTSIKIVLDSTKQLFFDDLSYMFRLNKLQPINEQLDAEFIEMFKEERDEEIFEKEKKQLLEINQKMYSNLLKFEESKENKEIFGN